jgi:hypothetical protein
LRHHSHSQDPDVLAAIDDLTVSVLEIRWLTEKLVGAELSAPERADIGAKVDRIMVAIDERAAAVQLSTGALFEIINVALEAEPMRVAA